mmetsp:Transcript_149687/g.272531  ORF Transcript_149687/g.272531 Transcript_149687/m.272531 type:complete len:176 (+) Transcript_149687:275-802(+)
MVPVVRLAPDGHLERITVTILADVLILTIPCAQVSLKRPLKLLASLLGMDSKATKVNQADVSAEDGQPLKENDKASMRQQVSESRDQHGCQKVNPLMPMELFVCSPLLVSHARSGVRSQVQSTIYTKVLDLPLRRQVFPLINYYCALSSNVTVSCNAGGSRPSRCFNIEINNETP